MKYRGFSLVELLVTVLITSIVVMAAYQLLTSTTQNFGTEDNRRILDANLRNAELLLQRDISRTGYGFGYTLQTGRVVNNVCQASFLPPSGTWNGNIIAFNYATEGDEFAKIRIIGSMSDYDDFKVASFNANSRTIEVNQSVTQPLVANQVYNQDSLVRVAANGQAFHSIFNRVFRHAAALEISTPDVGTAVALVSEVNASSDSAPQITIAAANVVGQCSIDPIQPLSESNINPIVSIVYTVKDGDLLRCYSNISADNVFAITEKDCDVLLQNVAYFDVYPITDVNNTLTFDDEKNDGVWSNVHLSEMSGVMFRIGAKAEVTSRGNASGAVAGSSGSSGNVRTSSILTDADGKTWLLSHARGVALFQTSKEHTSATDSSDIVKK